MKPIWSMGNCTRKQWLTLRTKNQDHDVELEAAGYYLIEVFGAWIEGRGLGLGWFGLAAMVVLEFGVLSQSDWN
jgi:hypothetical protein